MKVFIWNIFSEDATKLSSLHDDRMLRKFEWNLEYDPLDYKECIHYTILEIDKRDVIKCTI